MTALTILDLAAVWFFMAVALAAMLGGALNRNGKRYPPVDGGGGT